MTQTPRRDLRRRHREARLPASMSQDYSLGPRISGAEHYALLRHTAGLAEGTAVEFGVGKGESTRILAEHMPVIGFDSFQGLPEDWRDEYPRGSFAAAPPAIPGVRLVIGLFAQTLPDFTFPVDVGLVHIDCDLYSSTRVALALGPHLKPGTYVVFDEWHGYDTCEQHEQRAWREYADQTGIQWEVVGHDHEAWSIRIAQ
ncbi:methyltransferase [Mycobacterium phage Babsiella]|uniref:Methyltransferase n=1 Tax=Mycobacterium phage Babsiella TaxID=2902842 RepID=G8I6V8_9CAUD|nr:methyltransferase [Mycobacterium phage Babsiella]AER48452.1 hypothetical protein BABSIELLA_75 [Mycobacterium phage Babsiella]